MTAKVVRTDSIIVTAHFSVASGSSFIEGGAAERAVTTNGESTRTQGTCVCREGYGGEWVAAVLLLSCCPAADMRTLITSTMPRANAVVRANSSLSVARTAMYAVHNEPTACWSLSGCLIALMMTNALCEAICCGVICSPSGTPSPSLSLSSWRSSSSFSLTKLDTSPFTNISSSSVLA